MEANNNAYRYSGRWGNVPALRRLVSFLPSHMARTGYAVEIGWFLADYAATQAGSVLEARKMARLQRLAEVEGNDILADKWAAEKKASKTGAACIIPAAWYQSTHAANDPHVPSGIMCVDIDRRDNMEVPLDEWAAFPDALQNSPLWQHVGFIGESRSGWEYGGYFVLLLIDGADNYPARFEAVRRWFLACGVNIDRAAANINHCRAVTWQDADARERDLLTPLPRINPDATPYGGKYTPPPSHIPSLGASHTRGADFARAVAAVKYITAHHINIADDFDTWTRCALALSGFGVQGLSLFCAVSSVSSKYREGECEAKFRNALRTRHGCITIATFFQICKDYGVPIN